MCIYVIFYIVIKCVSNCKMTSQRTSWLSSHFDPYIAVNAKGVKTLPQPMP